MPSVLIVDDEPNIRRMVGALVAGEGYEVRDAPDGPAGFAGALAADGISSARPPGNASCAVMNGKA